MQISDEIYNFKDNVRVKSCEIITLNSMCLKGQYHAIFDFRFPTDVVETNGKFTAGVVDTGGKTEAKSRDTVPLIP
jgi:hypothetical protein